MINSPTIGTMALLIQAAVQSPLTTTVVSPLEATSAWIDDCISLLTLGY